MRVRVDRGDHAVHIALGDAPEARRAEVAETMVVGWDAEGRIVGIEVRGVDPAAFHAFTVELAGLADRPADAAPPPSAPQPEPTPPAPPAYTGPLTWDPEAEAAMLKIPFFSRGRHRLAASALARQRGQERVTVDIVQAAGR